MKPNIILITIDALRADRPNTSNIDQLAKESIVFSNAFATGPGTPYSFPSILTSTYPLDYHGPRKIDKPRVMISDAFKWAGYFTAAFHSSAYLSEFFGYNQGWDCFEEIFPPPKNLILSPKKGITLRKRGALFSFRLFLINCFLKLTFKFFPPLFFWASYLNYRVKGFFLKEAEKKNGDFDEAVQNFISSYPHKDKPLFFWVHYMDVHRYNDSLKKTNLSFSEYLGITLPGFVSDYYSSANIFFKKFSKKYLLSSSIKLYDGAVREVDRKIGELLADFKKKGLYENSVVCLASDHGEEFLEHQGADHITDKLYNELLKVPLLIKIPGRKPETVAHKVSLIDLASTLLSLAGINPPAAFKGQNLLENRRDLIFHQSGWAESRIEKWVEVSKIAECKVACQTEDWKYILDHGDNREEIYNLKDDPQEQVNLAEKELETLFEMRRIVQEFEKNNPPLALIKENEAVF